jgi:hypothetical protein
MKISTWLTSHQQQYTHKFTKKKQQKTNSLFYIFILSFKERNASECDIKFFSVKIVIKSSIVFDVNRLIPDDSVLVRVFFSCFSLQNFIFIYLFVNIRLFFFFCILLSNKKEGILLVIVFGFCFQLFYHRISFCFILAELCSTGIYQIKFQSANFFTGFGCIFCFCRHYLCGVRCWFFFLPRLLGFESINRNCLYLP